MTIKEAKKAVSNEIKDRLSSDTMSDIAKKIQKYSGYVFILCSLVSAMPIALPVTVAAWLSWGTLVTGVVSGLAQFDKSGKKIANK